MQLLIRLPAETCSMTILMKHSEPFLERHQAILEINSKTPRCNRLQHSQEEEVWLHLLRAKHKEEEISSIHQLKLPRVPKEPQINCSHSAATQEATKHSKTSMIRF